MYYHKTRLQPRKLALVDMTVSVGGACKDLTSSGFRMPFLDMVFCEAKLN